MVAGVQQVFETEENVVAEGRFEPTGLKVIAAKEKRAKFAVEGAEAALHFVRLYRTQSFPECFENPWRVVWMNRNLLSRAQSLLCR
jgi:hypothetical protein